VPAKLAMLHVQRMFIHHLCMLSKNTKLSGIGSMSVLKGKALFGP
jgi:hypothetical protein